MKSYIKLILISGTICAGLAAALQANYIYGKTGHTKGAEITLGHSDNFNDMEIQAAADTVLKKFESDFRGCELQSLRYENGRTQGGSYTEPEYLTLYSDFYGHFVIGSDETVGGKQTNWEWILKKNESGSWELCTWGYA